jgi:hypothetical protein
MRADASQAASYATATANLRAAARWLLTAAAAAGAVLVAGVQLTGLGSLGTGEWPRLIIACASLAAGLSAVGYLVFQASLMLTDEWITLAELDMEMISRQLTGSRRRRDRRLEEIRKIRGELESYQDEFYGSVASSISDLYRRLIDANRKAREFPSPEHAKQAAELREVVETLVQAANYSYARSAFAGLRQHLIGAGAVFVAGIVIFAYAANPPAAAAKSPPAPVPAAHGSPFPRNDRGLPPLRPSHSPGRASPLRG